MAGTAGMTGSPVKTPNSYGSVIVNGQLVGAQTRTAYFPSNYGGGVSAVPAASPLTIPPALGYGQSTAAVGYGAPAASTPGGGGTVGTQNRGNFTGSFWQSPAPWAFIFMALGVLWLRGIHWRKG